MDPDRVIIFDTTLRDGEQSPGISLNRREARDRAPARPPGGRRHRGRLPDRLARRLRGRAGDRPRGPRPGDRRARPRPRRRHRARRRGGTRRRPAADPHLHLDVGHPHRAPAAVDARGRQGQARAAVAHARSLVDDVEFSPMDATRADVEFTAEVIADRHRGGRDDDQRPRHGRLRDAGRVRGLPAPPVRAGAGPARAVLSVHCHDDLGLAVANSLAGVQAGARQVECAINGIGERAGNASLEEIVMLLAHPAPTRSAARPASTPRDRAHEPHGLPPDGLPGAAQQGDRRAQRVRARVRHPPGRRAQGALDVRDHGRHDGRAGRATIVLGKHSGRHALQARSRSWATRSTGRR